MTTKENDLGSVGVIQKRKGVVVFRFGKEDRTSIRKIAYRVTWSFMIEQKVQRYGFIGL
jgi:hypothetical protein